MKDEEKTKEQLIQELGELRQKIAQLGASEAERKRIEETLIKSKRLLEKTLQSFPDAVFILDAPTIEIMDCNPAASEIFGYHRDEMLGRRTTFLHVNESTVEEFRRHLYPAIEEKGFLHNFEFKMKRKDGSIFLSEHNVMPLIDEQGNRIGWVSVVRNITDRKRAEEALKETQRSLEAVVETVPSLIVLTDAEGRILMFNRACEELTGYKREEVIGKKIPELFLPPEWIPVVQKRFADPYAPEVRAPHENPWLTKSGEERLIEWRCTALPSPKDGRPCVLGTGVDITERKQADEALRKSEAMFQELFDNAPVGYHECDVEGRITSVNRTELEILGYRLEEMIGQPVWNFIAEGEQSRQAVLAKLAGESPPGRQFERTYIRKDGTTFPVLIEDRLLRDAEGRIMGVRSTIQDITERKRAEEALRGSEEKYRNILENVEEGYFEVDIAGNFTFFNDSLSRLLGYSRDEMMGMNNRQYTDKENAQRLYQAFNRVYRTGEPTKGFDWEIIRKDGTKRYIEASVSLIKNSSGQPIGFRGIVRDITERKRAEQEMSALEEQLRQSQKIEAIGQLAGGIAHDFNNILTVIKGYSQLSLLGLKEGDPLRGSLDEIRRASDRASDLTRQILAFSRRLIMEMRVLDLNTVLSNLEKMLRRIIGEDIELMMHLAKDLGRVKTDPGQIEQVIMNLTVNARDAMKEGGKLTIETANVELDETYARKHVAVTPGRYVMLAVSDTGIGMTLEVRGHVFEPFFTTKEKGKGTGLGLSTVYGIVKQSEGYIWVYSELGRGSTFKIYLPRIDEPMDELKEKVMEEFPRGNETILVVEDDEEVRRLSVRILKERGYKVLEAAQGLDAFVTCDEHEGPIHLLLTDVVMPKMNGRELAEHIAEIRPGIKVLYMSGYTDNTIARHGILEKDMNYIQKPFSVEKLARKVREVLDQ